MDPLTERYRLESPAVTPSFSLPIMKIAEGLVENSVSGRAMTI